MLVYQCIHAVMIELSKDGIAKDRTNTHQKFKFRGIDDVYNSLAPVLARAGLIILPRVIERTMTERSSNNGGAIFVAVVDVEFDLVSAQDGSKHTIRTVGEAMDSADKATNKAMSAAYKYACIQAFCIPTEGDNDADAHTHSVKPIAQQDEQEPQIVFASATDISKIKSLLIMCEISEKAALDKWKVKSFEEIPQDWVIGLLANLEEYRKNKPAKKQSAA